MLNSKYLGIISYIQFFDFLQYIFSEYSSISPSLLCCIGSIPSKSSSNIVCDTNV